MTTPLEYESPQPRTPAQTAVLVIGWLWVGIPLTWGVVSTFIKSLPLFR